jgi:hypothetical protein
MNMSTSDTLYINKIYDYENESYGMDAILISNTGTKYYFFRNLLSLVSDFFKSGYSGKFKDPEEGIQLDVSGMTIVAFLNYISPIDDSSKRNAYIDINNALELLQLADYIQVLHLKSQCISFIQKNVVSICKVHSINKYSTIVRQYVNHTINIPDYNIFLTVHSEEYKKLIKDPSFRYVKYEYIDWLSGHKSSNFIHFCFHWLNYEENKEYIDIFLERASKKSLLDNASWSYIDKILDLKEVSPEIMIFHALIKFKITQ